VPHKLREIDVRLTQATFIRVWLL